MAVNFLGPESNFLGIEESEFHSYENSRFVIQQVPYEHTSSYHAGSAKGPGAMMEASHFVEFFDEEAGMESFRHGGICSLEPMQFDGKVDQDAVDHIAVSTSKLLNDGKFVVSFGAEHTVTYGFVKAYHEHFGDLSVLQIDAHSDLRQEYNNNKWSHASVMARVHDLGVKIGQVGIRAQCKEEAAMIRSSELIETAYAHQIRQEDGWQERIIGHLTENVYITIDADGFDPSVIPHVGTPEPNGLFWQETIDLLQKVVKARNVVGFDIVEVAPVEGYTLSEFSLSKLAYKIIGMVVNKDIR
jgi:agmatinase